VAVIGSQPCCPVIERLEDGVQRRGEKIFVRRLLAMIALTFAAYPCPGRAMPSWLAALGFIGVSAYPGGARTREIEFAWGPGGGGACRGWWFK